MPYINGNGVSLFNTYYTEGFIIKAGMYEFYDFPRIESVDIDPVEVPIKFTVSGVMYEAICIEHTLDESGQYVSSCMKYVTSDESITVYDTASYTYQWIDKSYTLIHIPEDTVVPKEFCKWFPANTTPMSTISGCWQYLKEGATNWNAQGQNDYYGFVEISFTLPAITRENFTGVYVAKSSDGFSIMAIGESLEYVVYSNFPNDEEYNNSWDDNFIRDHVFDFGDQDQIIYEDTYIAISRNMVRLEDGSWTPHLIAPVVTIEENILTITDTRGLAESFEILIDGEIKSAVEATETTFDLSTVLLPVGSHRITVRSKADGYIDSPESEAVNYEVSEREPIIPLETEGTPGLQYILSDDATYYSVYGIGTATDTDIVISPTCNGLPVTDIAFIAFMNTNITSVKIPDSIKTIQPTAFRNTKLTEVVIPYSVKEMGYQVFNMCYSLKKVTILGSIPAIESTAFYMCTRLSEIVIPSSVTEIITKAFDGCTALKTVYFTGTKEQWDAIDIDIEYNSQLSKATIVYNYIVPDET